MRVSEGIKLILIHSKTKVMQMRWNEFDTIKIN